MGPECQATPKLLKVSVLLGIPVSFPEKRLVEPKGCAEPGPGSPDPVSGEWGRTSRERGEAPASHTLQTTSQIPQRALFCTCAWKQRVGVLELFLISPDGWVPVLDNKHFALQPKLELGTGSQSLSGSLMWQPWALLLHREFVLPCGSPQVRGRG